jgi:formylglycine-generating enzyme required for sulfatase activity
MQLQLMWVKESIIFTRGKRNILGQSYTRSGKRQSKGDQLANFKQGNGDYGGLQAGLMMELILPMRLKYPANDFGLYDMAGNVAEWVADVYTDLL